MHMLDAFGVSRNEEHLNYMGPPITICQNYY
jgi:hypothetical protein